MREWNSIMLWLLAVGILFCPSASLANYTYDGLGRRIVFEDPVAAVTTRYYYDGQSVIEERDAADARVRFHVNGTQFIDERVTTFEDSTSEFAYYLVNQSFSVAGMGNADGSVIDRLDYSSTGDFAGGGPGALSFFHDADVDLDLDLRDFASFQNCFGQTDPTCLATHDFDTTDVSDGDIDLDDYARFFECFRGPFVTPDQVCVQTGGLVAPPSSGTFALHGRPLDILSDGHTLIPIRARYYDAVNGRWLQRDSAGYVDGNNLYESFASNAIRFVDPSGRWIARRIGEIINENGRLTVGDIRRLGKELNSSPAKQIAKLTDEELQLLRLIGGTAHGTPWTESTLSSELRKDADEDFGFLAPPYRYRVQASLSTRRRMLFILLFQNQGFSDYVTDLYRVSRDFNPVHFAAERGIQVGTGVETITGREVSRIRAGGEFVVYLALLKGLQAGPRVITKAAGGEVPGVTAISGGVTSNARVRVFRVEGSPNARIAIGPRGGVAIADETNTLFLNFGSRARAEQFFAQKLGQGLPGAKIKSFEVSQAFLEQLRGAAVAEPKAAMAPGRPLRVDVTKAPDQFGLRPQQIKALKDAIKPGTGRIEP